MATLIPTSNGLFINPIATANSIQNIAEANGQGDEYRKEVAAQNARDEAQELYDKAVAERKAIEQMQQKSASDEKGKGKGSSKKLIIGALAVVAIVIIVVIIMKKK